MAHLLKRISRSRQRCVRAFDTVHTLGVQRDFCVVFFFSLCDRISQASGPSVGPLGAVLTELVREALD